jgi:hypothetical protein
MKGNWSSRVLKPNDLLRKKPVVLRLVEAEEIREVERREDAEAHARKGQQDKDEERLVGVGICMFISCAL